MNESEPSFDTEEVVNVYSEAYDGPHAYNYEPARHQREQEQSRVRKNNHQRRETELWCEENQWRTGQVTAVSYGR